MLTPEETPDDIDLVSDSDIQPGSKFDADRGSNGGAETHHRRDGRRAGLCPLTHSVFWGAMAHTLIGGTAVGTVSILLFLPALYAVWFRIKPTADEIHEEPELRAAMAAE